MPINARPAYRPGATFVSTRDTNIGGEPVKRGEPLSDAVIQHIGPRRMRQLYEARWIDFAPVEEAAVTGSVVRTGGSETPPTAPSLPGLPEGVAHPPENPESGEPRDNDTPPPPPPPKPPLQPGEAMSVFHEGFGRWYGRDGEGNRVGEKMTKAEAEAINLPVTEK